MAWLLRKNYHTNNIRKEIWKRNYEYGKTRRKAGANDASVVFTVARRYTSERRRRVRCGLSRAIGVEELMTVLRVVAIFAALTMPAVWAPILVRARRRMPAAAAHLLATLICLVPLAAPWPLVGTSASRVTIWLVTIAGAIVLIKAIDWLIRPRYEDERLRVWLTLSFWPALQIEDVLVRAPHSPERDRLVARRISEGSAGVLVGLSLTAIGRYLGMPERSITIDMILKTFEIYLLAGGVNHLLVAGFALAGFQMPDGFRYPILANSILDFWARFRVMIHRWLKQNIFGPVGRRRRRPVLGVLAVFGFSGVAHEYLFVPVTYDLLGWQLAFFGLHGLGAITGTGLGRAFRVALHRRVPRMLAIVATVAFMLTTAPIFIHCVDFIFDLHRDVGGWVLRRLGDLA
jgi:hypothetical protein